MTEKKNILKTFIRNSQPCLHARYKCNLPVLVNAKYCAKHILEDVKNKTYKRCSYTYKNRKRCNNAVPAVHKERKMLCDLHRNVPKKQMQRKAYQKNVIFQTIAQNLKENKNEETSAPFVGYKNVDNLSNIHNKVASLELEHVMEEAETQVQQEEAYNMEILNRQLESSEGEEDNDDDNLNLSILTEQEIVRTNLLNLKKLQEKYKCEKAYLEHQYKQLDVLYKLQEVSVENKTPLTEYEKLQLKTWTKYTRHHPLTALLKNEDAIIQARNERQNTPEPVDDAKCIFVDDVITCDNQPLHLSKYCLRHITHDAEQTLFRKCDVEIIDGIKCTEPIVDYSAEKRCVCHAQLTKDQSKPIKQDMRSTH